MDLQQLTDRLDINDLLNRYADAVDRQDWEQLATCFTPDASIDYSASGGVAGTYPDVAKWLADTMKLFSMTQHLVTNSRVTIDGDIATGRAYFYNPMTLAGADGGTDFLIVGGYYNDRFVRTGDGWRIAERREEMAFMDGPFRRA
jgi:3-phenylpropionate/cinnamic acid dioxygenase small subunit